MQRATFSQNNPGLCGECANAQVIKSDRGSVFYLCRLWKIDPRYPKYPRLPVLRCPGYQTRIEESG